MLCLDIIRNTHNITKAVLGQALHSAYFDRTSLNSRPHLHNLSKFHTKLMLAGTVFKEGGRMGRRGVQEK